MGKPRRIRHADRLVIALFLVILTSPCWAENPAASPTPSTSPTPSASPEVAPVAPLDPTKPSDLKFMVFPARSIDELSGGVDTNPDLNASLSTILQNRARQTDFTVINAPDWKTLASQQSESGDQSDVVLAAAKQAGVQATLSLFWFQEGRRITLIAKIYDVWQQRMVAGATVTGLDDLSLLNTTDNLLAGLIGKLVAESPQILAAWGSAGPVTMSRELVLKSPAEGAKVSLVGGELLGTIKDGKIALPFRPLAVNKGIDFKLEEDGFYSKTVSVEVKGTKPELELPGLYPKTTWTALISANPDMLSTNNSSGSNSSSSSNTWLKFGFGLGLRWFPVADTWFVQGNYMLNLINNQSDPSGDFTKPFYLHQAGVETAIVVLTPPDWIIRFFVGFGLGTFLSRSPNQEKDMFFDPYLELPYFNTQINLHPVTIEIECGALFVFDSGYNLLPPGLVKTFGPVRLSLGWKW